MTNCLRALALDALIIQDPAQKIVAVNHIADDSPIISSAIYTPQGTIPGAPDKPELVPPQKVGTRSVHTPEGQATLLHAIAHIEFNAINLALDIIWRFPNLPDLFYRNWLQVAKEETYHFNLICDCLKDLGYHYGDFTAHRGLWDMAEKTQDDILARLALVPRTLEARGLDVNPAIRQRFHSINHHKIVNVLDIILRDEVGHVKFGNDWYLAQCRLRQLDPIQCYADLLKQYGVANPKGPFNIQARKMAGFTQEEIQWLSTLQSHQH